MSAALTRTALLLLLAAPLVACAQETEDLKPEKKTPKQTEVTEFSKKNEASAADAAAMTGSPIMREVMDTSSKEAFEAALTKVEEEATAVEFRKLKVALEEHVMYNMASRGKVENLLPWFEGKTPEEVIASSPKRNR